MRLSPAVFGAFAPALLVGGCAFATGRSLERPSAEPVRAALRDLGVEGKSYVNDLGAVSSVHLKDVHVFGDDLLVEDIHGHLVYIDGSTLFARWEYRGMEAPFEQRPSATPSAIVGLSKGKVYVISRSAGLEELPPKYVPVVPSAAPVANESTLFVPTYHTPAGNKTVVSVSLATGMVGWGYRTSSDVVADLGMGGVPGSEVVYAATQTGTVLAFPASPAQARDVEPSWSYAVHSPVERNLVVDDYGTSGTGPAFSDVGFVTENHRLVVLDRIGGTLRFEGFPDEGDVSHGTAQFSSKHVFYEIGGELRAFDRTTGARAWGVKGANQFVAERGIRTIVRSANGTLTAVETKTGKVLGRKHLPGWTFPRRAKPDATIYAVGTRGMIVATELGW